MSEAYRWKKARRSGNEGACVELAHADHLGAGLVVVRDSKNRLGPLLVVELSVLTAAARSSRLDLH